LIAYCQDNESIVKKFLVTKKLEGCTDRTIAFYASETALFFRKINKSFFYITTDDIRYYLALRMQGGAGKITLDNSRRVLSSFFTFLSEEDLIQKNPMLKIKKVKADKVIKKPFTEEDIEKLRINCKNVRERAMMEFFLSTAARVSEVALLKKDAIDWAKNMAIVWGKGNKERPVYINATAKLWVTKYLDSRKDDSPFLFVWENKNKNHVAAGRIEQMFRELGNRAGVKNCHPHRFRRTAATFASMRGMPLEQIQRMLGHSQISTTMIYTTVDDNDVQYSHAKFLGG
jgi:site-specific recombinase XerD